jgi:hypothetical protein
VLTGNRETCPSKDNEEFTETGETEEILKKSKWLGNIYVNSY